MNYYHDNEINIEDLEQEDTSEIYYFKGDKIASINKCCKKNKHKK